MTNDVAGLRLIAHPLRLQLLSLLTGRTLSAADAARELGQTQANVSYHLRRLACGGLIELVDEVELRGGVAKRYTCRSDDAAEAFGKTADRETFAGLMESMAAQLNDRASSYREGSPFAFTDAHVDIPAADWPRITALARELGVAVHEAAERDDDRPRLSVTVTVACFERDNDNDDGVRD